MAKYWDKLNFKLVPIVRFKAEDAGKKKDFIEAAVLQVSLAEGALRIAITSRVGSRKKAFKKYWDGDGRFSQLIDYYELLEGKEGLIKRLRLYNESRNRIVHHIFEFPDMKSLIREAKKNYVLGKRITKQLLKAAGL